MFYRFLQHSFWLQPALSRTTRLRAVAVAAGTEAVERVGYAGYRGGYYPRRGYGAAAVGAAAVGAAAYGAYGAYNNCYDAYGNYICSGQYRY
jgi:hypothetical protein